MPTSIHTCTMKSMWVLRLFRQTITTQTAHTTNYYRWATDVQWLLQKKARHFRLPQSNHGWACRLIQILPASTDYDWKNPPQDLWLVPVLFLCVWENPAARCWDSEVSRPHQDRLPVHVAAGEQPCLRSLQYYLRMYGVCERQEWEAPRSTTLNELKDVK